MGQQKEYKEWLTENSVEDMSSSADFQSNESSDIVEDLPPLPENITIPKVPISGYMVYCNEKRPNIIKENPGKPVGVIAKLISEKWNAMNDEEKKVYNDVRELKKQEYNQFWIDHPELIGY